MKEALLYERLENSHVSCRLCSHRCLIAPGKSGFCGVRQNNAGILYSLNYGKLVVANADPVEKKPLYHYLPGTTTFSIASFGCNFRCGFCQNWSISQAGPLDDHGAQEFSPEQIVRLAKDAGCRSIAYTYTEPTIFFEFALETAKLAKDSGLGNIFVTNGYLTPEAIEMIAPYLDAANVDLKFFQDSAYQKICSARLGPVMEATKLLQRAGVWIEITTLVIPGENDSTKELAQLAAFIAGVSRDIPWHISRFHADYKFDRRVSTPESTLRLGYETGIAAGLNYVYVGNFGAFGQDTPCPGCQKTLIKRDGFSVLEAHLSQGRCAYCKAALPGKFDD